MSKIEKVEDFYNRKFGWIPDGFHGQIGHFNVFELEPFVGKNAKPVPYVRRDYYKIMFVKGYGRVHYADREIDVNQKALSFSNPKIPYKWEGTDQIVGGYFCIFNDAFFNNFGNISQYTVFHPEGNHIFELDVHQEEKVIDIFHKMLIEINTNYSYKYDLLKALALELVHIGMKLEPDLHLQRKSNNASQRIVNLFLELLERQFPIDENHAIINFRSASEFAKQLNIHVNHLNRAVKEIMNKTTTQVIGERIFHEAKILLKQSVWNVSEIAFVLGFNEPTHFNNFFKKYSQLSPTKFRKM